MPFDGGFARGLVLSWRRSSWTRYSPETRVFPTRTSAESANQVICGFLLHCPSSIIRLIFLAWQVDCLASPFHFVSNVL